jgi:DNA-binding transcriptional LysR family regulator
MDVNPKSRRRQTLEPRPDLSTNSYLHLRSRALAGEGVTELPPFLAAQGIKNGQLHALLPKHSLPEQKINLLYPSHRRPSSIVRAYLDYCQNHLAQYLGAR